MSSPSFNYFSNTLVTLLFNYRISKLTIYITLDYPELFFLYHRVLVI